MNKTTALGILVLALIVIGLVWYAATHPTRALAPGGSTTTTIAASPLAEHGTYYDIVMNYPTTTPLAGSANSAAVTTMHDWIMSTVAEFKGIAPFDTLSPADAANMGLSEGRKYTLQTSYLIGSSEHTVSYIFTVYEDTGGAHGNTFFKTFVFDTTSGALLALPDLFTDGSSYLNTLSSMARGALPGIIGDGADTSMIRDGTTPDAKNFADFFFDGADFVILFPPYQVAPYAAGPQTLRLHSSDLKSILKSQYP
jgi:hypothetical protein